MGFSSDAILVFGWELTREHAETMLKHYRKSDYDCFRHLKLPETLSLIYARGSTEYDEFDHYALALLATNDPIALENINASASNISAARKILEDFAPQFKDANPQIYAWPELE